MYYATFCIILAFIISWQGSHHIYTIEERIYYCQMISIEVFAGPMTKSTCVGVKTRIQVEVDLNSQAGRIVSRRGSGLLGGDSLTYQGFKIHNTRQNHSELANPAAETSSQSLRRNNELTGPFSDRDVHN